jgi:hypothetical protein
MDMLTSEELQPYVARAERGVTQDGLVSPFLQRRFKAGQFRSPLIWPLIRAEYAREKYGESWDSYPGAADAGVIN